MRKEITIKIAGEAGMGTRTIGVALCGIFKRAGLNIFAHQDYMSRIRGGNNFFQVRVSSGPVHAPRKNSDIVLALDRPSVAIHGRDLDAGGVIIVDRGKFGFLGENNEFFDVPFYEMAESAGGSGLFANAAALGVLGGMVEIDFSHVEAVLLATFAAKSGELAEKNVRAAKSGYEFSRGKYGNESFVIKGSGTGAGLLMTGNDAVALGAIRAGCKFYAGYPMSPSTGIMETMARYGKHFNIAVEQAEDEMAAVNMIIGASFAGARSMTATSGGGFSLMTEGLSLAGMLETPVVIADVQRPAPATGFPTRTEQADLDLLISAGHGEFARVVFSPGTAEQAFYLTVRAFNLAEKYQIPVLMMSDQHLAESYRNIEPLDMNKAPVRRYVVSKEDSRTITDYKRYELTESGISPFAVPSWIDGVVYADSDEHTEEGHITEDAGIRVQMVEKRFNRKMSGLYGEVEKPYAYNTGDADVVLIGFGSTYGVMKELCEMPGAGKTGFIHLPQVWPFPSGEVAALLKNAKKAVTVENNAAGQLARLIRRETGFKVNDSVLKFDGRPFDVDMLAEALGGRVPELAAAGAGGK